VGEMSMAYYGSGYDDLVPSFKVTWEIPFFMEGLMFLNLFERGTLIHLPCIKNFEVNGVSSDSEVVARFIFKALCECAASFMDLSAFSLP